MALRFEDPSSRLRGVESTVKVDFHDFTPLIVGVVLCRKMRSDTSVTHHDVKLAKIFPNLLQSLLNDY